MFFAIIDRVHFNLSISNACVRLADKKGNIGAPHYFFSVTRDALAKKPWREGTVYLLPRDTFIEQQPVPFGEYEGRIAQLASLEPVPVLARLNVAPRDFPFLDQVHGHDDTRLAEYAHALQTGTPWPED